MNKEEPTIEPWEVWTGLKTRKEFNDYIEKRFKEEN